MIIQQLSGKLRPIIYQIRNCSHECPKILSRYNYAEELEVKVNEQIKNELFASNTYLSLANHFARSNIGLIGCSGFFQMLSNDEREHAFKLMQYQNKRGGMVEVKSIPAPLKCDKFTLSDAIVAALDLETNMTNNLVELFEVAKRHNDECSMDFIVTRFLYEQMDEIHRLSNILSRLKATGETGVGTYLIDIELMKKYPLKEADQISFNYRKT